MELSHGGKVIARHFDVSIPKLLHRPRTLRDIDQMTKIKIPLAYIVASKHVYTKI